MRVKVFTVLFYMVLLVAMPGVALAYVGPGAGLGVIGSLISIIAAIVVAFLGIILYPLILLRKKFTKKNKTNGDPL